MVDVPLQTPPLWVDFANFDGCKKGLVACLVTSSNNGHVYIYINIIYKHIYYTYIYIHIHIYVYMGHWSACDIKVSIWLSNGRWLGFSNDLGSTNSAPPSWEFSMFFFPRRLCKLLLRVPLNAEVGGWLVWLLVGGDWNVTFIFPFSWECHHPNWRIHMFQRGWNHQPV